MPWMNRTAIEWHANIVKKLLNTSIIKATSKFHFNNRKADPLSEKLLVLIAYCMRF
jgi:hypothetical protein